MVVESWGPTGGVGIESPEVGRGGVVGPAVKSNRVLSAMPFPGADAVGRTARRIERFSFGEARKGLEGVMRIDVHWLPPLEMWDGTAVNLIYDCDWDQLPDRPGVYVFARCFGEAVSPLYVGKALSLRGRVRQQLNNARLMMGIENSKIGPRFLLPAEVTTRSGHYRAHALELVERALIEHYLSQGYELHNIQGTRITADEITFWGNNLGRLTCPRQIAVPRRQRRVSQ